MKRPAARVSLCPSILGDIEHLIPDSKRFKKRDMSGGSVYDRMFCDTSDNISESCPVNLQDVKLHTPDFNSICKPVSFTRPIGIPLRSSTHCSVSNFLRKLPRIKDLLPNEISGNENNPDKRITDLWDCENASSPPTNTQKKMVPISSTPYRHSVSDLQFPNIPSERQIYKRLLDNASVSSSHPNLRFVDLKSPHNITITINDQDLDERSSVSSKGSTRYSISGLQKPRTFQSSPYNTSKTFLTRHLDKVQSKTDNSTIFGDDEVDKNARSWLEACDRTPYLSDNWITNLRCRSHDKVYQLEREKELAEANVKFWEKQRILAYRERVDNLEQRLACLLCTPPVLADPYLVPQPIPIELPYKPTIHEPKAPKLPVLSAPQLAQIDVALRSGSPDDILVDKFRLSVTRRELMTLTGLNWLSDMVINVYLQLLASRSQQSTHSGPNSKLPRVAVLSTFFYAKLTAPNGGGYAGVRRWTRQSKLLDQDLILVPIHDRGMHWCLACIDLRAKTVTYYDSMGSENNKCLKHLMEYLKSESMDKKGVALRDPDSWQFVNTEDTVPQQFNGSDCGVFLCTYAEFLSRDAQFTFSQDDMPNIRKRMIYEILTQQLLTTGFKLQSDQ